MFGRNNRDKRRATADLLGKREPEEVQSAEFTFRPLTENSREEVVAPGDPDHSESLFGPEQLRELQSEWDELQARFVEDPHESVRQADQLIATALERIAAGFAQERDRLEREWKAGNEVDTEELRLVLQRYRAFFNRLLSM